MDIASPGTGPLGQAGLGGQIDNHYWERVGIPVLMSAVSFGAESYTREALTPDQSNFLQQNTDNTLSGVLGELAKIKPTLHKNQGDPRVGSTISFPRSASTPFSPGLAASSAGRAANPS